jgi:hypothetical protein
VMEKVADLKPAIFVYSFPDLGANHCLVRWYDECRLAIGTNYALKYCHFVVRIKIQF